MLDVCASIDIMGLIGERTSDDFDNLSMPFEHDCSHEPWSEAVTPGRFRQPSLEVAMALHDVHVTHQNGAGWTVKQPSGALCFDKTYGFRLREHAEAFGRALAHRNKVALVVHHRDGHEARYAEDALSYPAQLS
jgi:hypothetical protein